MPTKTTQQITKYFSVFSIIDVTFNKEVIELTGLNTKQVYLKIGTTKSPCLIYSCSMSGAKVIANVSKMLFEKIRELHNIVSLRYSFKRQDKASLINFFVTSKVGSFKPYNSKNPDTNFINLEFTQKPPDDLIEILGSLLEIKTAAESRKEIRITINEENLGKLGLKTKDALVLIENVPRKCLIRDLSLAGAKVLLVGLGKFLLNKPATLKLSYSDSPGSSDLKGTVIRTENVMGRKDITVLVLQFDEKHIPMEFRKRVAFYFQ